jgi:hypothetical protein
MNHFEMKTNYESIEEAVEKVAQLIENSKKTLVAMNLLTGEIKLGGEFILSSKARGAAMSEFIGKIVQREDGVYLVGIIQPKESAMKRFYLLGAFNLIFAFILVMSGNFVFVIFALLLLFVLFMNMNITKKGNYLRVSLKQIFK